MAVFNPGFQQKHEETYLASRPADAPNALARPPSKLASNTVANVGQVFLGAVEAKDVIYKDRIRKEMTADVDANRDPYIGASTGSGGTDGNVPVNLVKQIERMNSINAAHKTGDLNEKYYWMQMENIARATRSRYPGYREYIDNVMSSLVGGTPANTLARMAMDAGSGTDAAANRRFQLEKDLAQTGQYNFSPEELAGMSDQDLLKVLNNYHKNRISREENRQRTQDEIAAGTLTDRMTISRAQSDVFGQLAVDETLVKAQSAFNTMRETLLNDVAAGRLNEDTHQALLVAGQQLVNRRIQLANEILNTPEYLQYLPHKDRQDILKGIEEEGRSLIQGIAARNYTAADIFNIRNSTRADADKDLLLSLDSTGQIRAEAAMAATSPEMYKDYLSRNHEKRMVDNKDQAISDAFRLRVQAQALPTYSMSAHAQNVEDNVRRGVISETQAANIIDNDLNAQIKVLATPNYPTEWKLNSARTLFSQENANFLRHIRPEDSTDKSVDRSTARHQMFMRMLAPDVVKGMESLKSVDPSLYDKYNEWRNYNFNALFKTEMADMQGIVVNRQSLDLSIDPETGALNLQPITEGQGTWESLATWWTGARNSVDRMNMAIDAMRPGWEAAGRNPAEEVNRLFTMSGVNISAEKGKSFPSTLFEAFTSAVETVKAGPGENSIPRAVGRGLMEGGRPMNEAIQFNRQRMNLSPDDQAMLDSFTRNMEETLPRTRSHIISNRKKIQELGDRIEKMETDGSYQTDPETYENLLIDFQILTDPTVQRIDN